MNHSLKFKATREEMQLIISIAERTTPLLKKYAITWDWQTILMDVEVTHCNGCPLNLAALADAPDGDFIHDLFGIRRHLDRNTGTLGGCFLPRYALPRTITT